MENPRRLDIDDLNRFLTYYNRTDDPLRRILIGHLLIEEALEEYIVECVPNPEPIKELFNGSLTFFHKLKIARALTKVYFLESVWEAIEKLNELRNKISHHVDYSGFADKENYIVELVRNAFPENFEEMESQGFTNWLSWAIAHMYLHIKHLWKMEHTEPPPHTLSERE